MARRYDFVRGKTVKERPPSSGHWAPRGNAGALAKKLSKAVVSGAIAGTRVDRAALARLWGPNAILSRAEQRAKQNIELQCGPTTTLGVLQAEWKEISRARHRIQDARRLKNWQD